MTSQLSTEVFTTFWLLAPSVVSATAAQQEAFTARVAGGRFKTSLARRTDVEAREQRHSTFEGQTSELCDVALEVPIRGGQVDCSKYDGIARAAKGRPSSCNPCNWPCCSSNTQNYRMNESTNQNRREAK